MSNPSTLFQELFRQRSHLPDKTGVSREETWKRLDALGEDAILERLASGRVLNEIAIELELPILYLREWVNLKVDRQRLNEAMRAAAESFALKGQLALLPTYRNQAQAAMAKELAASMRWMAERLAPQDWGPPRAPVQQATPVTIVFEKPDGSQVKEISAQARVIEAEEEGEDKPKPVSRSRRLLELLTRARHD